MATKAASPKLEAPPPAPPTTRIVSAPSAADLAHRLIDAGILVFTEAGAKNAPGVVFSPIAAMGGMAHAMVDIDPAVVTNSADVWAKVADLTNIPGAPLRMILGGVAPEVLAALPRWAYEKALDKLGLIDVWEQALVATVETLAAANDPDPKRVYYWWKTEQSSRVSTLEPEWRILCTQMTTDKAWAAGGEAELIALAKEIAQ